MGLGQLGLGVDTTTLGHLSSLEGKKHAGGKRKAAFGPVKALFAQLLPAFKNNGKLKAKESYVGHMRPPT